MEPEEDNPPSPPKGWRDAQWGDHDVGERPDPPDYGPDDAPNTP